MRERVLCLFRVLGSWTVIALGSPWNLSAQSPTLLHLKPPTARFEKEGFTDITGVRELRGNRLLVVDYKEHRLVVIDWSDGGIRDVGRIGEGPNEYDSPGGLYPLATGRALLTDYASRRWFVVDDTAITLTLDARRPLNRILGPALAGVDTTSGSVLGSMGYSYSHVSVPGGTATADSIRIILAQRALGQTSADTLSVAKVGGGGRFGFKESRKGAYNYVMPNPLATEEQAVLFPDGWIAVARTDPYRIDWRLPDGVWDRGDSLPVQPVPVNDREKCFAIAQRKMRGCRIELFPDFPKFLPPFLPDALFVAPGGELLVERTRSLQQPDRRYDVISRTGSLVGVLQLEPHQKIVGSGAHSVYVVTVDDLDLEWLSMHPWPYER